MNRIVTFAAGVAIVLSQAALARAHTCELRPDLCNLTVTSFYEQSDLERAIDVVILGDGFQDAYGEDGAWRTEADDVIATFKAQTATGIYDAVPGLYNFHVVDVVSAGTDVTNSDTDDTALGMKSTGLITANESALSLAALNAPDVDVIVAVANATGGRANANFPYGIATGGRMRLSRSTGPISHEMGHALFHLADEYVESSRCTAPPAESALVDERNVTTDPTCAKFAQTPGASCIEGGRYCGSGVFRSASGCLMRSSGNRATCPACAAAIREMSVERLSGADFANPWAVVSGPRAGETVAGMTQLQVRTFDDWFHPVDVSFVLDGRWIGAVRVEGTTGSFAFDTRSLVDGEHTLYATVSDLEGRTAKSPAVTFETANFGDTTPPEITSLSPADGSTVEPPTSIFAGVSGSTVDLSHLELYVDGELVAFSGSRFVSHSWSPEGTGVYAIEVRAIDVTQNVSLERSEVTVVEPSGGGREDGVGGPNEGGSQGAQIYVDQPRSFDAVGAGFALRYQAFGAESDVAVRLWVDGEPRVDLPILEVRETFPGFFQGVGTAWVDASEWGPGIHAVELVGRSDDGTLLTSSVFYLFRENPPLTPLAFIVSPHPIDNRVTGVTEIEVAAAVDGGLDELVLWADGFTLGSARTSPAQIAWDTTGMPDGCVHLVAEARSAGGISGFSDPLYVCIDNRAPSLALRSPLDADRVGTGVVPLRIESEDFDVVEYRVVVDGAVQSRTTDASGLYAVLATGVHTLRVDATDRVGLEGTTAEVTVDALSCVTDSDCDDGITCTTDTCADTGWCINAREPGCCVVDDDCSDDDPCTSATCSAANTCVVNESLDCCADAYDCSDGDRCTADVCENGTCSNPVNNCCDSDTECSAAGACGVASCVAAPSGVCSPLALVGCCEADLDCDDGDPCTLDRCAGGTCTHDAIAGCCASDAACDDGDPCTADRCLSNRCVGVASLECCSSEADCGGTTACRSATCDAVTARCSYSDDPTCCITDFDCNDGDPCTEDVCDANACTTTGIDLCADEDGDGVSDGQDNCRLLANPLQGDLDADFVGDDCDLCPNAPDPGQLDRDGDGLGDACDGCPSDSEKSEPGPCGCGEVEVDRDGDGSADCIDACPDDSTSNDAGACGCGVPETDRDGDGAPDCIDACPDTPERSALPCEADPSPDDPTSTPPTTAGRDDAPAPNAGTSVRAAGCGASAPAYPWVFLLMVVWRARRRLPWIRSR